MRYLRLLCVLIAGLFLMGATSKDVPVDMDKVVKVERQIQKMSQAEPVEKTSDLRTEEVRENEINAYIAHLISQEKQKVLKSLQVTLGAANQVTGRATFDLAGLNLGAFLPPLDAF